MILPQWKLSPRAGRPPIALGWAKEHLRAMLCPVRRGLGKRRIGSVSTPCVAVSSRETTVFIPYLLEL